MLENKIYYDGSKLLSLKDLNGNTPEIYICTGNKAAGKTTYFSRLLVNRFLKYGKKFGLIYRFNYELDDISDKFFKDIGSLFFPEYEMKHERKAAGIYSELFIAKKSDNPDDMEWISCGYGLTLNSAEQLKKYSHLLSDIDEMFMDEFESETNHYCNKEIHKFQLLHSTVARGQGKQSRYVPVFMAANVVSVVNPYFLALGVSNRIQRNTKFLKGNGYVVEVTNNTAAANAMKQSAFVQAFGDSEFNEYAINNHYLNDSEAFIENISENCKYIITFKYMGKFYSIKETHDGLLYVSDTYDRTFLARITMDVADHDNSTILVSRYSYNIRQYSEYFRNGLVRFKNQVCKNAFITLLTASVL